jgi:exopolysaccharide biosynthesis WecB/TagA/CpsF family protein
MQPTPSTTPSLPTRPVSWARPRLLNVAVDDLTLDELLLRLDRGTVFTLNLDHLWLLQRDPAFHRAYANADVVTADSKYVYWALRWLGRPIRERICGSDLLPAFCAQHRENPAMRVFLLGAMPGVADRARARINAREGREVVVGAHGPSMNFAHDAAEIAEVAGRVAASAATVLVVGLGSPKQEIWIDRHRHLFPGIRIFMGVGASIDYEAGEVARAPRWMSRIGLEWFYRAVTNPRRYLRRYVRDLEFFALLLRDAAGRYRPPSFPDGTGALPPEGTGRGRGPGA